MAERSGWLVSLESANGLVGYGDCAPLPEAGTERAEDAGARLQTALPALIGEEAETLLAHLDAAWMTMPAARCAIETALIDLLAQRAGMPLARWLNPAASLAPRVNAAIGGLDAGTAARAVQALKEGFAVLKVKVGVGEPHSELHVLRRLADGLPPGAKLRLDANGAWEEVTARRFIDGLAELPVEALEEPLAKADFQALQRLQDVARFSLALDESLAGAGRELCCDYLPVRRLVLKPMVLGGPLAAYELARRARRAGLECVATTTLDSAVGTWAACHLAAALGNDLAHGLATAAWLAEDVGNLPHFTDGRVRLDNRRCGLGFCRFAE